jgi:hypothetical protein
MVYELPPALAGGQFGIRQSALAKFIRKNQSAFSFS